MQCTPTKQCGSVCTEPEVTESMVMSQSLNKIKQSSYVIVNLVHISTWLSVIPHGIIDIADIQYTVVCWNAYMSTVK